MVRRLVPPFAIALLGWTGAQAAGVVLDGAPIALNKAQNWCVAPVGPLPNWDTPAHPECEMRWKVLAERDGRILYSARYAWPSPRGAKEPLRVLTEVVFEGARDGRLVRRLFAVQDDEANVRLAPLRVLTVGGTTILESKVCMSGTGECGREIVAWTAGRVEPIRNDTVTEIRAQLPKGYDIKMNPEIDLASLSGTGKAWAKGDADCCPSAAIEFRLRLEAQALHVAELKFQRRPS